MERLTEQPLREVGSSLNAAIANGRFQLLRVTAIY
jgi:hypothetical protein